jgi:hypothetical protein
MDVGVRRVRLLRSCVMDDAGLSISEEETVVDVMCTICERINTVSTSLPFSSTP